MRRLCAVFLALLLTVSLAMPAGAAVSSEDRQEDLDSLCAALLRHPNPFYRTPETIFQEKKADIEARLAETDDLTFLLDLQSLIALVRDSHTTDRKSVV